MAVWVRIVLGQPDIYEVDRIPLFLVAIMFLAGLAFFGVWIWAPPPHPPG